MEQLGQFPLEHGQVTIAPENPHFWCPDDPYLYRFTVETAQDKVESYFAIRSLEIKKVGEYPACASTANLISSTVCWIRATGRRVCSPPPPRKAMPTISSP